MSEYYRWLPSATVQSSFLEYLRNDPRFDQIQFLSKNDHYFLFVNRDSCAPTIDVIGITTLKGFGPAEGPYPQWNLPRVRWMNGSESTICFDVTTPGTYRTTMRYRPVSDGSISIRNPEGTLLNDHNFKKNEFTETMFKFSLPSGQQCLHLSARLDNVPDSKQLLLFTKFSLRNSPE